MSTQIKTLKRSIATVLLSAIAFCGYSQDHKLEIGLNGGFGISSVNGTYYSDYFDDFYRTKLSGGSSYAYGLLVQANFSDVFSLVVNPMYERKGGKNDDFTFYNNNGDFSRGTVNAEFNYFTIPILAKFSFGDEAKFFVNVGPYISFLLSAEGDLNAREPEYSRPQQDIKPYYNNVDFGPAVGCGVDIPVNDFIIISGELRGSMSLFTINDKNNNFFLGIFSGIFGGGQRHFAGNFLVGVKFILPTE